MARGFVTSLGQVGAIGVAAVALATWGCAGRAEESSNGTGGMGGGGMGGLAGKPIDSGTDGASAGGSGGLLFDASDDAHSDADAVGACKCEGSDYVVNVVDGAETIALRYPFASPELSYSYLEYCFPSTPAVFTTKASQLYVDVTACAEVAEGPPCIQLDAKSVSSYFDDGKGVVWKLTAVVIDAPGLDPPKVGSTISGTFSATATAESVTKPLGGSFSVCYAYADWKPI